MTEYFKIHVKKCAINKMVNFVMYVLLQEKKKVKW